MSFKKLGLLFRLMLSFTIVLTVTTIMFTINHRMQDGRNKTIVWVNHTNEVMSKSDKVLLSLIDMETGFRGFLLSGKDDFLQPYNGGKERYRTLLNELVKLTSDNPAQVERWEEVLKQSQGWEQEWATKGIQMRRDANRDRTNLEAVMNYEASSGGKKYMDSIRSKLAEARKTEENLLDLRIKEDTHNAELLSAMNFTAIIISILLGLAIAILLSNSILKPLNLFVDYVNKIAKGNIPDKISQDFFGEFISIKNSLNQCIDNVNGMVADANMLSRAAIEGKLSTRADASKHEGDFRKIVGGVNQTLDAVIGPLNVAADYVDKISHGAIPVKITDKYEGDFNTIKNNLNNCIDNINALVIDANMLAIAAVEGKLATRADASKHQGDYRKIVEGVNKTLDSVIGPANEANRILRQISLGNLREKVTIEALGDHQKVKDAVNAVHSWLQDLIVFVTKIANGDMSAEIKKSSEQDQIYEWLILLKSNIANLVVDVNQSVQYAINGELSNRADESKHLGEYRKIIKGLNQTMDAVVAPMKETTTVLREMETGNLTVSVTGDYKGDYSIMKNALNNTIEKFNDLMSEINNAGEQILISSKQVSDSSQALSSGASEQASSVEEITSTVNEIEGQTRANADNAKEASNLANDIKSKADNGNSEMKSMLTAMDQISEASENIAKIIKEIDAIAFQTNILALNAAVEAARAGQHGKGFNVVAEEVRNLASRSANAAKETANLIESSIKKVEVGKKLAHNTAEALNQVTNSISKATEIIGSIALSSNEQSEGVAQVNSGLTQISQVTMSNAATAEESASASLELSNQAESFQEMVKRFKLKETEKISIAKTTVKTSSQSAHKQQTSQSHSIQPTIKKKIVLQDNVSHEKY